MMAECHLSLIDGSHSMVYRCAIYRPTRIGRSACGRRAQSKLGVGWLSSVNGLRSNPGLSAIYFCIDNGRCEFYKDLQEVAR